MAEDVLEYLLALDNLAPLAIIIAGLLDGIIVVGFVLNGSLLFVVAVYFLSRQVIGFPELVLCALTGAFAGDQIGFAVGRLLGDRPFSWWPLKNRADLRERMTSWLEKYGALGLLVGRFFSPTRSIAPFLAAALGMRYRNFLLGDLLSCSLWVSVWSAVVYLVVSGYLSVSK